MAVRLCPQCGAPIDPTAIECKYCGERLAVQEAVQQLQSPQVSAQVSQPNVVIQPGVPAQVYVNQDSWPVKSRAAAGIFAILLGSFGIHKFYLGNPGMGILYLCFCWTGIPGLLGFIEGIIYLVTTDAAFEQKHQVRVR